MNNIYILYRNYLSQDGNNMSIGGIQTYISMLVDLAREIDLIPVVYQYANCNFEKYVNGVKVVGVNVSNIKFSKGKKKLLVKACLKECTNEDILLFACDTMVVKTKLKKVLAIQHGITWDVTKSGEWSKVKNGIFCFYRFLQAIKLNNRLENVNKLICVDYNFPNWYKTQFANIKPRITVIPNCPLNISKKSRSNSKNIRIIFARRFFNHRGVYLFANSVDHILSKYENVEVTFAGEGPAKEVLVNKFRNEKRVSFIEYESKESIDIHLNHDIAVIPSLGSEGTSFSLLEAMLAKCAVISSNVGGMTNVVIDKYNGLIFNPKESELNLALENLIENEELRKKISINGYNTVIEAFHLDNWKNKWKETLIGLKEQQ